jgi:hypothetical protein
MDLYTPRTNYTLCKKTIIRTYYLSICDLFLSHNFFSKVCTTVNFARSRIREKSGVPLQKMLKCYKDSGMGKKTEACTPPPLHLQLTTQIRDKRTSKDYARNRQVTRPGGEAIVVDINPENKALESIFLKHLFSGSTVCWPILQMCHPFMIFERYPGFEPRDRVVARRITNLAKEKTVQYWLLSKK